VGLVGEDFEDFSDQFGLLVFEFDHVIGDLDVFERHYIHEDFVQILQLFNLRFCGVVAHVVRVVSALRFIRDEIVVDTDLGHSVGRGHAHTALTSKRPEGVRVALVLVDREEQVGVARRQLNLQLVVFVF
jgi:hypothetical protein